MAKQVERKRSVVAVKLFFFDSLKLQVNIDQNTRRYRLGDSVVLKSKQDQYKTLRRKSKVAYFIRIPVHQCNHQIQK